MASPTASRNSSAKVIVFSVAAADVEHGAADQRPAVEGGEVPAEAGEHRIGDDHIVGVVVRRMGLLLAAVNFIILPEFFDRSLTMIEQDNVLRHFLISALTGEASGVDFLHFKAKDILPVENLIENMLWTLIEKKPHTNTIVSVTMGLILMNLSTFSEIPESGDDYEHALVYKVLKYIESNYKSGTLSDI